MLQAVGMANLLIGGVNVINGSGIGLINLLLATVLMYGLGRISGKREEMEKERQLHD